MTMTFDPRDPTQEDVRIDMRALFGALAARSLRITLVTLLLVAITFVALQFVAKSYESTASILIEARDSTFLRATNSGVSGGSGVADATAIASQMELVQSRDTLLQVIQDEHLLDVPALTKPPTSPFDPLLKLIGRVPAVPADKTEIVLTRLRAGLDVVQERESSVFSIVFSASNPELAARIANAIAKAHVARRAGLVVEDTADATRWLQVEIDKLRTRVLDAESKVAQFRIDHDLYVGANSTSLVDQQLSGISTQMVDARQRESTARSRASVLKQLLAAGQPIDGVPAVRDSATIQQLAQQKAQLQGDRAQKLATLLPNHPDIRSLSAQIAEVDAQIAAEGRRVASALDSEAEVERDIAQSLSDELTRLKSDASTATRNNVTLGELEREAKADRDLLEAYLARFREASARTDSSSALPDVRVVSLAAPSNIPASPKVGLILGAVFVLSLAGQAGLVLFGELISGKALRQDPPQPEIAPETPERANPQDMSDAGQRAAALIDGLAQSQWQKDTGFDGAGFDEVGFDDPDDDSAFQPNAGFSNEVPPAYHDDGLVPEAPDGIYDNPASYDETVGLMSAADDVAGMPAEPEALGDDADAEPPAAAHVFGIDPDDAAEFQDAESEYELAADQSGRTVGAEPEELEDATDSFGARSPFEDAVTDDDSGIVFLSSLGEREDTAAARDNLISDALERGLRVAVVEADGPHPSREPGLSDLCAGAVGFGEVVAKSRDGRLARVPAGRAPQTHAPSPAAVTLVHALADIFDMVVVDIGRPGAKSQLRTFSGARGAVVMLSPRRLDDDELARLRAEAGDLGFTALEVMPLAAADMQVA